MTKLDGFPATLLLVAVLALQQQFSWPILPCCEACGTSTHISIAHEATQFFQSPKKYDTDYLEIIKSNQDAFVAGNPYPDAMYPGLCYKGKYHNIAEDTHWTPFLNATVNYIRKTYKQPWNQDAQKLVAFTFGYVSHEVADISWHSLGIDQGFIRAMADVNFHGVFGNAHSNADAGGDMVSQLEGDDIAIQQYKWHVPSKDLYEIYKEYYGQEKVTQKVIESCSELLYLEWLGEKLAGAKLFKMFAKKSPFLVEQLHNYFLGGIHDMASWTGEIWTHTAKLIEEGVDTCNMPRNPLFITCNKSASRGQLNERLWKNPGRAYPLNLHGLASIDIKRKLNGNGMELFPKAALRSLLDLTLAEYKGANAKANSVTLKDADRLQASIVSTHLYSEAGRTMTFVDSLPIGPTLIVSAPNYGESGMPQRGMVFLVNATALLFDQVYNAEREIGKSLDLDAMSYQKLKGLGRLTKFGWDVAVVDLNKDGIDDLAISAPSTGATSLKYLGAVHVFFGKKGTPFSSSPDVTLRGQDTFDNFGYTLKAADVNSDGFTDLIIGSPFAPGTGIQRGRVDIVLAQKDVANIRITTSITGDVDYQWFGLSFDFVELIGKHWLIVGAPAYRNCALDNCAFSPNDVEEQGRILFYDISVTGEASLWKVVNGPSRFSKFGATVSIGKPFGKNEEYMIAVGAPSVDTKGHLVDLIPITFNQAGRVYIFNLTTVLQSHLTSLHAEEAALASFSGDRSYGRMGMSLGFSDVNQDSIDDLLIGSPYRTEDITEEVTGAESGAMYVFNGGSSFPTGDVTKDCGIDVVQPCPGDKASKVFFGKESNARFGSSFATLKRNLAVSSPRSSTSSFHGGAINVFKLKQGR
eukprot:gene10957-12118_t